jgi:hypothetical protein
MERSSLEIEEGTPLFFRLCPRCFRAIPGTSHERYCINDGTKMLEQCPRCHSNIASPYARFCAGCGFEFAGLKTSIQDLKNP